MKADAIDNTLIMGLDIIVVRPCGHCLKTGHYCTCPMRRVGPFSKHSQKLVWKCVWCRKRRGALTEAEIEKLKSFTKLYGWQHRPLALTDDGGIPVR
jgi:hypothetical protein